MKVLLIVCFIGAINSAFAEADILNMGVSTTKAVIDSVSGEPTDIKDISITFDAADITKCKSLGDIDGGSIGRAQKGKLQLMKNCPSPELYLSRIVKKRKGNTLLVKSFSNPCKVESYQAHAYFCTKD